MSKGTSIILILVAIAAIAFIAVTFDTGVEAPEGAATGYEAMQTEEGNLPQYDMDSDVTGNEAGMTGEDTTTGDMTAPEMEMESEPRTETPEAEPEDEQSPQFP